MKRLWNMLSFVVLGGIVVMSAVGCKTFDDAVVVHDELFTYDISYAEAYNKALLVLETLPNWKIIFADGTRQSIKLASKDYVIDDEITVLFKSIDKNKVSVELAPSSQKVRGADEVLKAIDKALM